MKSTDLFSHRYQPEVISHAGRDPEPIQLPIFSDQPASDSGAATPPS